MHSLITCGLSVNSNNSLITCGLNIVDFITIPDTEDIIIQNISGGPSGGGKRFNTVKNYTNNKLYKRRIKTIMKLDDELFEYYNDYNDKYLKAKIFSIEESLHESKEIKILIENVKNI